MEEGEEEEEGRILTNFVSRAKLSCELRRDWM